MSRRCSAVAVGLSISLVTASGAAAATRTADATGPAAQAPENLGTVISEADAHEHAGRYADAARRYADAYAMTSNSNQYRGTDVALQTVLASAKAYRSAFDASDDDYTFAVESKALLDAVVAEWTAMGQPVPDAIRKELEWAEARIAEKPPDPVVVPPTEPEPEPEPEPASEPEPEPEPQIEAEPEPEPEPEPDHSRRDVGIALTGLGLASTIGGIVSVAVGVPVRGAAQDYRTEVLQSPQFTALSARDQDTATSALQTYVETETRRGVILMGVGGAAIGVGVTGIVVGSIILARSGRRSAPGARARLSPRVAMGRGSATMGLRLRF
ncbi:MAG: hypothetical protein AAF799_18935 [Myxococcota bacterium]